MTRALTGYALLACAIVAASACEDAPPQEHYQTLSSPILVTDLERMGGDYPDVLMQGLSRQLIDEVNCIQPGVLERFEIREEPGYIWTTRNIHHYLRPEAVAAAERVASDVGDWISITSGYRDVGMQYYDYLWGQRLGFLAARPGSSRHQAGQAIDVQFHDYWREHLLNGGWSWPYGTDDRPHFEWRENNTPDLMVESVRAYQRLWNRNNPEDLIDEDGAWGPQTEARMDQTEAEGFEFGGCDLDRDGYAAAVIGGLDCADDDPDRNPDAEEICGDGVDNDCVNGDAACSPQDADPADVAQDTSPPEDTATAEDTSPPEDTGGPEDTATVEDTGGPEDAVTAEDAVTEDARVDHSLSAFQEEDTGAETATACSCSLRRERRGGGPWWLVVGALALAWRVRRRGGADD